MIPQQMPLFHPALLLKRQLPEHFSQVPPQITIQRPTSAFRKTTWYLQSHTE